MSRCRCVAFREFLSRSMARGQSEGASQKYSYKPVGPSKLSDIVKIHLTASPSVDARYGQGRRVLVVDGRSKTTERCRRSG